MNQSIREIIIEAKRGKKKILKMEKIHPNCNFFIISDDICSSTLANKIWNDLFLPDFLVKL